MRSDCLRISQPCGINSLSDTVRRRLRGPRHTDLLEERRATLRQLADLAELDHDDLH